MSLTGNIQSLVEASGGYNAITQQQQTFYEAMLIKALQPFLTFLNEGQKGTIPKGQGGGWSTNSIQWRKRAIMAIGTSATALTEGVPPNFSDVTWTTVTTQLAQYGAAIKHSDVIAHAGIDDNVAHFAEALGELAGLVVNTLIVNELGGGGTVQLGTKASASAARVNISTGDTLDNVEIKKAVRTLELAYVPKHPDGMYHGFVHVRQAYDLRGDTVWQALNGTYYGGQEGLKNGDLGVLHGVKLQTSVVTPTYSALGEGGIDIYGAFIMGPDAFGVRDFAAWKVPTLDKATGKGMKIMYVPADTATKDDPLGQFGTMGYKFAFVTKILDSARFVRLETAVA